MFQEKESNVKMNQMGNLYKDLFSDIPQVSEPIWRFAQVKRPFDDGAITCVEFNHDGELLGVGGKSGNVVIYKRTPVSKTLYISSGSYTLCSRFKSHLPQFDFLKSMEIEEKVNKIKWLYRKNFPYYLLSTNNRTVKLWKISERDNAYENFNTVDDYGKVREEQTITTLRLPRIKKVPMMVEAMLSRTYANLHDYDIHSISLNSDQETFLSADDLRINVWHLDVTCKSFNVVDIKPSSMAGLTEVITSADFHPRQCNVFAYSSSKGAVRLCDMRSSALCDRYSKEIKEADNPTSAKDVNFLNYVKFSPSGRYLMARDFMNVNVFDLKMEGKLLETYPVHDYLEEKRVALYKTQRIFDEFECSWSGNDDCIMTGSYNNLFKIINRKTNKEVMMEAKREHMKPKTILKPCKVSRKLKLKTDEIHIDYINYDKKIQFTDWHPGEKTIAVAAENDLFIYKESLY